MADGDFLADVHAAADAYGNAGSASGGSDGGADGIAAHSVAHAHADLDSADGNAGIVRNAGAGAYYGSYGYGASDADALWPAGRRAGAFVAAHGTGVSEFVGGGGLLRQWRCDAVGQPGRSFQQKCALSGVGGGL